MEAFVAVGTELHFGRAAEKLHIGQPTLSDLVRRLERELGATLLTRTTRRVALTQAGTELLGRAIFIIDSVEGATAAVRRITEGGAGRVRIGITPPVAPILAPHLAAAFNALAPDVELTVRRMWLPDLERTVADIDGELDLAITCARVTDPPGIISEIFCAEPLFVSLRPDHRLAARHRIDLAELAGETLGLHSAALFPAWALAQRQVLEAAGVAPPTAELADTDLSACRWADQHEVHWILTTKSVAGNHMSTPMIPVSPELQVPYTLQWCPIRAASAAVGRFVDLALSVEVPPGWVTQQDHLRHDKA